MMRPPERGAGWAFPRPGERLQPAGLLQRQQRRDVLALVPPRMSETIAGGIRPAEVDGVGSAVVLVQEQPAAEVAGDGLQRVGVRLIALGERLADDQDGLAVGLHQPAEAGRLPTLWSFPLIQGVTRAADVGASRGPLSFCAACLSSFRPSPIARWLGRFVVCPRRVEHTGRGSEGSRASRRVVKELAANWLQ